MLLDARTRTCSVFAGFLAIVLAGCLGDAGPTSDSAVRGFHGQLDSAQYDAIYIQADEQLRKGTSEAEFTQLLNAVHSTLGNVKSTSRKNWRVFWGTSGTIVTVMHDTEFEQGNATEQFVYRVEDGKALLMSYDINSRDLIIKAARVPVADERTGDQVRINHLDPPGPVTRGVETEFAIDVEATLDSSDHGIARAGFNVDSPDQYQMVESHLLDRGTQRFTFTVKVVPVDWRDRATFAVLVNIGPDTSGAKWKPTASDRRDIEVHP